MTVRVPCWAAVLLAMTACGGGTGERATEPAPDASIPANADRPTPNGQVLRVCGSHYAMNFDAGLEFRIIRARPVALVGFRVSPAPSGDASVKTFKVMVRLDTGGEATIETKTPGTALLYDRARFTQTNSYRLSDGDKTVRFVGCRDHPAVFNGAVLTDGPRTVDLEVVSDGSRTAVQVTAFGG